MAKVLDCSLEVSEFELQSRNYVHFQTNTFILTAKSEMISQLFFYKDEFGIK